MKSQAVEEERAFEIKGSGALPGGFAADDRELDATETRNVMARRTMPRGSASYEDEAPLGLFEVARGAASALRKSAFPLHGAGSGAFRVGDDRDETRADVEHRESDSPTYSTEGRARKRDMVSNAVKGGLGWMLGVQPTERNDSNDY